MRRNDGIEDEEATATGFGAVVVDVRGVCAGERKVMRGEMLRADSARLTFSVVAPGSAAERKCGWNQALRGSEKLGVDRTSFKQWMMDDGDDNRVRSRRGMEVIVDASASVSLSQGVAQARQDYSLMLRANRGRMAKG